MKNNTQANHLVPPQASNSEAAKKVEELSEKSGKGMSVFGMSSWVMNILAVGSATLLWGLINSLQIVAHFPLLNNIVPANN